MDVLYYVRKLNKSMSGSKLLVFILILSSFLPILMVVIGLLNLNNCTLNSLIPIWLIIGGIISALHIIIYLSINLATIIRENRGFSDAYRLTSNTSLKCSTELILRVTLLLLMIAWLIGGTILTVPSVRSVEYSDITGKTFCDKLSFQLLLFITLILWSLNSLFIIALLVTCVWGCIKPRV